MGENQPSPYPLSPEGGDKVSCKQLPEVQWQLNFQACVSVCMLHCVRVTVFGEGMAIKLSDGVVSLISTVKGK